MSNTCLHWFAAVSISRRKNCRDLVLVAPFSIRLIVVVTENWCEQCLGWTCQLTSLGNLGKLWDLRNIHWFFTWLNMINPSALHGQIRSRISHWLPSLPSLQWRSSAAGYITAASRGFNPGQSGSTLCRSCGFFALDLRKTVKDCKQLQTPLEHSDYFPKHFWMLLSPMVTISNLLVVFALLLLWLSSRAITSTIRNSHLPIYNHIYIYINIHDTRMNMDKLHL